MSSPRFSHRLLQMENNLSGPNPSSHLSGIQPAPLSRYSVDLELSQRTRRSPSSNLSSINQNARRTKFVASRSGRGLPSPHVEMKKKRRTRGETKLLAMTQTTTELIRQTGTKRTELHIVRGMESG